MKRVPKKVDKDRQRDTDHNSGWPTTDMVMRGHVAAAEKRAKAVREAMLRPKKAEPK